MTRWCRVAGLAALAIMMPGTASAQAGPAQAGSAEAYAPPRPPPCRMVGDVVSADGRPAFLRISPEAAARLATIGVDRAELFARMAETAIPETMGCWAMPVGDFDGQLVSVGMAQWNYGTGSLQPVLAAWRDGHASRRAFRRERDRLAPRHGRLIFSDACMAVPVGDACARAIRAAHGADGKLDPVFLAELTALFESDTMLQVQLDRYVALLDEVRAEIARVFPGRPVSRRLLRWAIDMRVQQKGLPPSEDVARLRARLTAMPMAERRPRLLAILDWYRALAQAPDQDGIVRDHGWNVAQWRCLIDRGIDAEQYELLNLTFLKSRTATGNSGRWQALTFSRRAKIVFGVGSVSGRRDGACPGAVAPPPSGQAL